MSSNHWEMWKLSHAYSRIGSGTTPTSNQDRYYTDGEDQDGVPWITTAELRETYIENTASRVTVEALNDFSALRVYDSGSLFIAMYGATIGRLGITRVPATCNQACCVLEKSAHFENRFLFYWLWHRRRDLVAISTGGGQPNLSQQDIREELALCPPVETQRKIARFLDEKTARIDGLIEKKRALLDRLAEKRQALITRAVTKGLNPAAPMKPSGIDWLGDIPAHWEVLPLRRLARKVSTGRTPPSASVDYFTDGEINWFTPGDFQTGIELHASVRKITPEALEDGVSTLYPDGTVFLVAIGATLGKVAVSTVEGSANQQINAILPEPGNDPHYLAYFLHGFREEVRVTSNGNTLGILNQEGTKSLSVLRPPPAEQREISSELRKHDRREGDVIDAIHRSVSFLGEYRAALITAGVTGKIANLQ